MNKAPRSTKMTPDKPERRTILYVDPDASHAEILRNAWSQLRLEDNLQVLDSQEKALEFLGSACSKNGSCALGAIVLDPAATGEATGPFMREVRTHCGQDEVPIVFWSQDDDTYKVLEGKGVESVLQKPMVLRLIQALDAACQLKVRSYSPNRAKSAFEPLESWSALE